MRKLFGRLSNSSRYVIKYDADMQNYVVVRKDQGILYVGAKEQCEVYVQNHN